MKTTQGTPSTPLASIPQSVARLRDNFNKGMTRNLAFRHQQLDGLLRFVTECEDKIFAALKHDLNKCQIESFGSEISLTTKGVKLALKNLSSWTKPRKVSTALLAQPGNSVIVPEPLGVVTIIGPWNYPLFLALYPLIGALAAGNCVVLKPSEVSTATSFLLANELPKYISNECLSVIEGGAEETTALLKEKFDHIFYTGNGTVAKIIMLAAAQHLTPVTLELGGKSPCIIDATADLANAARRIAWGKFMNAGQTCVAPDYVLIDASVKDKFLEELKKIIIHFYGEHPELSPDYSRIINSRHYQRLMNLLPGSGDIYFGGTGKESENYISPTILHNVPANAPVMADEIFGPILPVITIKDTEEAIAFINARPKPLSLYLFSSDQKNQQRIIQQTSSGSVGINVCVIQIAVSTLPFGGVGASGMGAYGGKYTFDTFTHYKSVLTKSTWFDSSLFYPPYTTKFLKLLRWI